MSTEKTKLGVHSEAGKLRKVMVCSPGLAHQRLTPSNCDELLFDDVIWVNQAKRDHFDFVTKMRERGIDVLEMHNLLTETIQNPILSDDDRPGNAPAILALSTDGKTPYTGWITSQSNLATQKAQR